MQRSMTNYIIICLESFWKAKAGRGKVMYIFAVVSIQYSWKVYWQNLQPTYILDTYTILTQTLMSPSLTWLAKIS